MEKRGDYNSLKAGSADAPESITTLAGVHETAPSLLSNLRPDYVFYKNTWDHYLEHRGDVDKQIADVRKNPNSAPPLFQAWVKAIDAVNALPPDHKLDRATLTNHLINTIVQWDNEKANPLNVLFHKGDWLQSPETTLRKGNGVCGDFATLKYETLKRCGFSDDELRLVGCMQPGKAFHTVLMANINGKNMVMDASVQLNPHDPTFCFPNAGLIPDDAFSKGYTRKIAGLGSLKPVVNAPAVSFNETKGMSVYGSLGGNMLEIVGHHEGVNCPDNFLTQPIKDKATVKTVVHSMLEIDALRQRADNDASKVAQQVAKQKKLDTQNVTKWQQQSGISL